MRFFETATLFETDHVACLFDKPAPAFQAGMLVLVARRRNLVYEVNDLGLGVHVNTGIERDFRESCRGTKNIFVQWI